MQSRPSANDQRNFTDTDNLETTLTVQHGLENSSTPSPPLSSADESGGVKLPTTGSHAVGQPQATRHLPSYITSGGLSPPQTPSPPSRNRIAEYESSRISSPRTKLDGPTFDVIKTTRKPGDKRSPISELPNGKLRRDEFAREKTNMVFRDIDSCTCASITHRLVLHLFGVSSIPSASHHPSCLENSVLPLLPRTGLYLCNCKGRG